MAKKKRKTKINIFRVAMTALVAVVVITFVGVGWFSYQVIANAPEFKIETIESSEPSRIYDTNGDLVYTYGSDTDGTRQNVTYEDIPQVMIDAIVAAEDSRFFVNPGFDLPRLFVAALSNVVSFIGGGGIVGGGSTITQQLMKKSFYPEEQDTIERKLGEMYLAYQATQALSKEEIVTAYLNKIYFGNSTSSIGIEAASKYYFNKSCKELTLPEAALLAGSLNKPYRYDPYNNLEQATARRDTILSLMKMHGYITQTEYENALQVKVENMLERPDTLGNGSYLDAYIDIVTQEVIDRTGNDPRETTMNIYTFLDADIQEFVYEQATSDSNYSDEDMEMAGAVQSSLDGRLVAAIGSRDYITGDLNLANVKEQPGSSLKPVISYANAIEYLDWCSQHPTNDTTYTKGGSWNPSNWDNQQHGTVLMPEAIMKSWNLSAIWALDDVIAAVGRQQVYDNLEAMGIDMSAVNPSDISPVYAIGGWPDGTTPIELCSVYATIANNGVHVESHTINYIQESDGNVINVDEQIQQEANQTISAQSAYIIRQVMLEYVKTGYSSYGYFSGLSNIIAKTGTSNWSSDQSNVRPNTSRDIWMTSASPNYTVSIWMGFLQEGILQGKNTSDYKAKSAYVNGQIQKYLARHESAKSYPAQPDGVIKVKIAPNVYPYKLATNGIEAYFKEGTQPTEYYIPSNFTIQRLDSFSATLSADKKINVSFTNYDTSAISDVISAYGELLYCVDVYNSANTIVYSGTYSQNSATVDYVVNENVKVVGYYKFANNNDIVSNSLTVNLATSTPITGDITYTIRDGDGNKITSGETTTSDSLYVQTQNQTDDSTFSLQITNSSGTVVGSSTSNELSVSSLTPDTYTVTITESDSYGSFTKNIIVYVSATASNNRGNGNN